MSDKTIKPEDFLNMDISEVMDWLLENAWDFALVPREPTVEMRHAFHSSMDEHKEGNEIEGAPDDQWDAMIKAWETNNENN
jgi:hypothetical protein